MTVQEQAPLTTDEVDQSPFEVIVRQVTWEADGIVSLQLVDPEGGELRAWEPGAHVDVVLPSGLVRQYSLCGEVADRRSYRISVLLEPESRGGSREIHQTPLVGKRLTLRGPRNHFRLVDAERYLFLAGGIGVTPIIPMIREATARDVPWTLVYGGRSRKTMGFLDEIAASASGGTVDIITEEERGYPDLPAIMKDVVSGTVVYCCGPPGMINAVEDNCARYLEPGVLHVERFTAPTDAPPLDDLPSDAFEVELARKGVTLTVPPDRSVLRVVLEAVPSFLYSCEEGYCGTCLAKVLEGEPDHRDTILTEEERAKNDQMYICVSRSKSPRLVLDI